MNRVYFIIGGNLGNKLLNLQKTFSAIHCEIGTISRASSMYRTDAWGMADQPPFVNQVLEVDTTLQPHEILKTTLKIEHALGRVRHEKNGPRTMDIDILFYNDWVIRQNNLIIPHPRLHLRKFTLIPLAEIAPGFIHPELNKTILTLLEECRDDLAVHKISI